MPENQNRKDMDLTCQDTVAELSRAFECLPSSVCLVNPDDDLSILYYNNHMHSSLGRQRGGFYASFRAACPKSDFEKLSAIVHTSLLRELDTFFCEFCVQIRNRELLHLRADFSSQQGGRFLICTITDHTSLYLSGNHLRAVEEECQAIVDQTGIIVSRYDLSSKTLVHSRNGVEVFGVEHVLLNMPQLAIDSGAVEPQSESEYIRFYEDIHRGISVGMAAVQLKKRDGIFSWFEMKYSLILNDKKRPIWAVISYANISMRREKDLAYEKWKRHDKIRRRDSIAVYECNLSNDLLDELDGQMAHLIPEEEKGSYTSVIHYVANNFVTPEDRGKYLESFDRQKLLREYRYGKQQVILEHCRLSEDKKVFWAVATMELVHDPYSGDIHAFLLVQDIDEKKQRDIKLHELSETDPLTGLLNRGAVTGRITEILHSSTAGNSHAFIMLDIDRFKSINDQFGHQFGDEVLRDVSGVVRSAIRTGDICGRLGGDELVLFLANISPEKFNAEKTLQNICSMLYKQYDSGASVSGSLGLSIYPRDGITFEQLYHKADVALYEAKRSGRNCYAIYKKN